MSHGRFAAGVATFMLAVAAMTAAAVATPAWFEFHTREHLTVGLFQACRVVAGLNAEKQCGGVEYPQHVCGSEAVAFRLRRGWAIAVLILSAVVSVLCAVCALADYVRQQRMVAGGGGGGAMRRSYLALFLSTASAALLTAGVSIISHTYEGWVFCNMSFCRYNEYHLADAFPCAARYGYSMQLALGALALNIMASMVCAALVRDQRAGAIKGPRESARWAMVGADEAAARSYRDLSTNVSLRRHHQLPQPAPQGSQLSIRKRLPVASPEHLRRAPTPVRLLAHPSPLHPTQKSSPDANLERSFPSQYTEPRSMRNSSSGTFRRPSTFTPTRAPPLTHSAQRAAASTPQSSRRHEEALRPPPLPEGTWVFDDDAGLYWSDKEQLYFKATGRRWFFDPASAMYYVPELAEWVEDAPLEEVYEDM